ncbi:MAG: tRNA epoxyqueuosine(34) reductase QueG, partial [Planctomycetota bacterium]
MADYEELTRRIKDLALEMGFARVGIAPAGPLAGLETFRSYLGKGYHASMAYLNRNVDKRFNPALLAPFARSVISLAVGYAPKSGAESSPDVKHSAARATVARYARGRDYHKVLRKRARLLMDGIREIAPDFEGEAFAGSAPLCERSLAATAGIGWIGRNGTLIVPELGSYVVLAGIICNLPLQADSPMESRCEGCEACVRACPTGALPGDSLVDARRCLSYLSIEHRGEIDAQLRTRWTASVFGCDICQESCPHNRDVPAGDDELTGCRSSTTGGPVHGRKLADTLCCSETDWDAATCGSAVRRATYEMFMRNVILAAAASGDADLSEPLLQLQQRQPALSELSELIDWAL